MTSKFIFPTRAFHRLFIGSWRWFTSGLKIGPDIITANPELSLQEFRSTQLKFEGLEDVFIARLSRQFSNYSNFLKEQVDYQPVGFFRRGVNCGNAVCCLFYQFSDDEEIMELLNSVDQSESQRALLQKWIKVDPRKNSREDLVAAIKKTPIPCATGFLVGAAGSHYILTNNHVVPKPETLKGLTAVFRYDEESWSGSSENLEETWLTYKFDTDFYKPSGNNQLDYVLLRLNDNVVDPLIAPIAISYNRSIGVIPPITPFDVQDLLTLMGANLTPENREDLKSHGLEGDPINIIQHPQGRSKQVVVSNNRLIAIYPNFLEYKTVTEPGSSGSPLFNNDWELVGMHQAIMIELPIEEPINPLNQDNPPLPLPKITFLGIRLTSIVEDLRNQSIQKGDSELQEFIKVHIDEPLKALPNMNKRVFILAGDRRDRVLGEENARIESLAMNNLRAQITHAVADRVTITEINDLSLQGAIDKINQKFDPKSQDIAVQLLVDDSDKPEIDGLGIYYYGSNSKRRKQAQQLLENIKNIAPETPIFGNFSENVSSTGGLYFCHRVKIPSFVIYVGFLSNENDRTRIIGIQDHPANSQPIARAIAQWLQEFN